MKILITEFPCFTLGALQLGGHITDVNVVQRTEPPPPFARNDLIFQTIVATVRDGKTWIVQGSEDGVYDIPDHILALKRLDMVTFLDWDLVGTGENGRVACKARVKAKACVMDKVKPIRRPFGSVFRHNNRWRIMNWRLELESEGMLEYTEIEYDPASADAAEVLP